MSPLLWIGGFVLGVKGHLSVYDAIFSRLMDLFGEGLVEMVSLLRAVRR